VQYAYAMRQLAIAGLLLLAVPRAALATWSIIAIDIRTGQVIIASATCVDDTELLARMKLLPKSQTQFAALAQVFLKKISLLDHFYF